MRFELRFNSLCSASAALRLDLNAMADAAPIPNAQLRAPDSTAPESLLRRSWHAILSPFSPSALASLPNVKRPARHLRADAIPETQEDAEHRTPTVRDYHSITSLPPNVRVPKKIPTSIKVEGKVWFANERSALSPLQFLRPAAGRLWSFQRGYRGSAYLC